VWPTARPPGRAEAVDERARLRPVTGREQPPVTEREQPPVDEREQPPINERERWPTSEREPRSVAIVMLSAIGDAVHVLPVVCAIKRHAPRCRITWVLQPGPAGLVEGHPAIDEVLVFDRKRGRHAFLEIRRQLRAREFDVLLDLQTSFKAGLITALSGVRRRIGYDRRRARDLNTLFTNERIAARPFRHVQDEFLEFLEPLGIDPHPVEWRLGPHEAERVWQQEFFGALARPAATLIIATSDPHKDWLPERWAELSDALYADYGLQPVLAGGRSPRELELEAQILEHTQHAPVSTLGIPLRQLVALIDGSALVVSLDTGPMHMAVALGTPVIALMGYKDPRRVGPYRRFEDLIVNAFHESGELDSVPITRGHRAGRMVRIGVVDVLEKVELWRRRYSGGSD
jgi:heptosyltransferase I